MHKLSKDAYLLERNAIRMFRMFQPLVFAFLLQGYPRSFSPLVQDFILPPVVASPDV